ncbi:MAG: hypothetical protein JWL79_1643 [Frankiales bacterium]|nr:hypothetical protein [Frankiales bacterium]
MPRLNLLVSLGAALLALAFTASTPASAAGWAPAATAKVHPGVQTITGGSQCTANFVFTAGTTTYLGQAAHCSGTGAATDTNGCTAATLPVGTPVDVAGFQGTMAYNSWAAMRSAGEKDAETCAYNDLALIALPAAAVATTNPSVPVYGGPTALGTTAGTGSNVYSYGNSSLRLGLTPLSPKRGIAISTTPGGWSTTVYTVTPGIPGDSGSGFLDASGKAIGVLSTIAIAPLPLSNNIGNLAKEIAYAQTHGVAGLALVPGTEAFNSGALL